MSKNKTEDTYFIGKDNKLDLNNSIRPLIQGLIDSFPHYVLLVDEDHTILMANKAVRQGLGLDSKKIVDNYCPMVVHGCNKPYPGCPLEDAVKKNIPIERELYDSEADRWLNSAVYPTKYKTQEGKRLFIHTAHDITETKKALDGVLNRF